MYCIYNYSILNYFYTLSMQMNWTFLMKLKQIICVFHCMHVLQYNFFFCIILLRMSQFYCQHVLLRIFHQYYSLFRVNQCAEHVQPLLALHRFALFPWLLLLVLWNLLVLSHFYLLDLYERERDKLHERG